LYSVIAVASLAGALGLALHHPLAPGFLAAALMAWAGVVWRWPLVWLVVVPLLLPILDFLPWTGWVAIDEFDLLLLATLAGGYAHLARSGRDLKLSSLPLGLLGFLFVCEAIALFRGVADAGGFTFDWFGGYRDAMNSVRIFKSLFFAMLFAPMLVEAFQRDGRRVSRLLAIGIVAGLALVAIAVLRERATYPGLLDFSTPYRCAAMFWEMHVGGAALDGYLALSVPFAAWALLEARRRSYWLAAAALVVLVGYACLTTFSRGVYLALLFALTVLAWLRMRPEGAAEETARLAAGVRLVLAVAFLGLAELAFHVAGYRGALLLLIASGIALVANRLRTRPWWPASLRTQGGMAVAMVLTIEVVAVVNGGSFLMERLARGDQDLGGRLAHWRNGAELLHGPSDWLLGKGLGRLPDWYVRQDRRNEFPGDFRLARDGDNRYVLLSGPPSEMALTGLFGLAQRAPIVDGGSYVAEFDVRAFAATNVQISFCRKYLIYEVACAGAQVPVAAEAGWQHVEAALTGQRLATGPWYALHDGVFSISVLGTGRTVAIDNVRLSAAGRQLLANNDFSDGLARWFLSGSAYFVPWHIDNLALEVLIDQGALGLVALALFVVATLRLLIFGRVRRHILAPYIAGSLTGYLVVGLFSSLMDVPRVAFLFWLISIVSWLLNEKTSNSSNGWENVGINGR
jgi:hypothetical protein